MTDITVAILTYNEELHLERCLDLLKPLEAAQIVVVDSESTDATREIAEKHGARVFVHKWEGAQSRQYNWFVDNFDALPGLKKTGWTLRLDADEYLTPELIAEIKKSLPSIPGDVAGVVLKRRHIFSGKWVKHGTYPVKILRLYRTGKGRYSDRMLMDEHLQVDGRVVEFKHDFVDHSLTPFEEWKEKHRGYAVREAEMVVSGFISPNKRLYYMMPPRLRAVLYFIVRYVFRGGFLNGVAGFKWDWHQGLWYRWLIDSEIAKARRHGVVAGGEGSCAINLYEYENRHGFANKFTRLFWRGAWTFGARWTPRFVLNWWRSFILRLFGAKIGGGCRLNPSMEVWVPSRLFMGSQVWIDRNVNLYDVERITIGDNAIVSDGAYICTASHDISKRNFPLTVAPVSIGAGAWIASRAIVLPGVTVGEGAVVAAGAVVTKDVPPWTVVAGNPARPVRKRILEG